MLTLNKKARTSFALGMQAKRALAKHSKAYKRARIGVILGSVKLGLFILAALIAAILIILFLFP